MARTTPAERIADDLVVGAAALADETGLSERQIFHAHRMKTLPLFKIGKRLAGRKSQLDAALRDHGGAK